jgi:hypothetical protein
MNMPNKEWTKLNDEAKWIIRQLVFEVESRKVNIELFDPVENGYAISYYLLSGRDDVVAEYAEKLSIVKQGNRLEVKSSRKHN